MSKQENLTAEELMARLSRNPAYLKMRAAQEEEQALLKKEIERMADPILEDLSSIGITVDSLDNLVKAYHPLNIDATQILLRWLNRITDDRLSEQIIRCLAASDSPFDGRELIEKFENAQSENLRWVIAHTIAESKPYGITDWLLSALMHEDYGKAREMLIIAAGRLIPAYVVIDTILALFDKFPMHVAWALSEFGGINELKFLQQNVDRLQGIKKKEVKKYINTLKKRFR
jgi:hypothetical protein